jgi:hypothetical protein
VKCIHFVHSKINKNNNQTNIVPIIPFSFSNDVSSILNDSPKSPIIEIIYILNKKKKREKPNWKMSLSKKILAGFISR